MSGSPQKPGQGYTSALLLVIASLAFLYALQQIVARGGTDLWGNIAILVGLLLAFLGLPFLKPLLNKIFDYCDGILYKAGKTAGEWIKKQWRIAWAIIATVLLLGMGLYSFGPAPVRGFIQCTIVARGSCNTAMPISGRGDDSIRVIQQQIGDETMLIGLSDGSFAFDTKRIDGTTKQSGSDKFRIGDTKGAIAQWQKVVGLDMEPNDAEALIYLENQNITGPYVTIVVATTLSQLSDDKVSISIGRDDLQGVYLAQKEYNDQHKLRGKQVRVLIANLGAKSAFSTTVPVVTQQIVQLAQTDKTFVGVVGFPFSTAVQKAFPDLGKAQIPVISPTASSNELTGLSPYFFRIAPPDEQQGKYAAQYAAQVLHAKTVAVFFADKDLYSRSLASSFSTEFEADGHNSTFFEEHYVVNNSDTVISTLEDALSHTPRPDLIFFAGYADDLDLLRSRVHTADIRVMGGDALYELGGYLDGYTDIYFTSFSYPDTWDALCPFPRSCSDPHPAFLAAYGQTFDPGNQHPGRYSYSRPGPHSILSYDAMIALLQACNQLLYTGEDPLVRQDIQQELELITFSGVSGQIKFDKEGNPTLKNVVVLCVDSQHKTHLVASYGQFLEGLSASPRFFPQTVCL